MPNKDYDNAKYWAFFVSLFLMISKVMGFFREILTAKRFGASFESDAYFAAMTGIIIVVGALGAGLQTTLIPVFSDVKKNHGRGGKNRFFTVIMSMTLMVSILITTIIFIFASPYSSIIALGFDGDVHDLIVHLIRIGLPICIFLGITYVSNAYLQSEEVYAPHALMGIPYNLIFIFYLLFVKRPTVVGLMYMTIFASATQFFIQLPALRERRVKFKFRLNYRDRYLKQTVRLVMPIILSSTVYQINLLIDKTLASTLAEGSISALNYATKVNTLVISVFVVAITSVIFPKLANAVSNQDEKMVGKLFSSGLNLVSLVAVPASIGLIILSKPIITVLFQRGQFDEGATVMTAGALLFYAPGLVGQSLRMCLENMYYSIKDTKTPMYNGIFSVIINIMMNFILIKSMAHKGLALATSISSIVGCLVLYFLIRKKIRFDEKSTLLQFVKILISGMIMGVATYLLWNYLSVYATSKLLSFVMLVVTIVLSVFVYGLATLVLGVKDTRMLIQTIKDKLGRNHA